MNTAIAEKRRVVRAEHSYDELFAAVTAMNLKIVEHMHQEELDRAADMADISAKLKPLDDLISSMPRDEHNHPSIYMHRKQHEGLTRAGKHTNAFKSGILAKAGELVMIGLVVLIANGSFETVVVKLFGH